MISLEYFVHVIIASHANKKIAILNWITNILNSLLGPKHKKAATNRLILNRFYDDSKIVNETHYLDKLSQIIQTFQNGELSPELLHQQVEALLETCDQPTDKYVLQLQKLIKKSNLSPEISESLLGKVEQLISDHFPTKLTEDQDDGDPNEARTRVVQREASIRIPQDKSIDSSESSTGDSSLLQNLLNGHQDEQQRIIEPNVIISNTYRLVSKVGEGGMGEVWKAIDLIQDAGDSRDRYVAIKFLNPEIQGEEFALRALIREFARYKQLIHPNLVRAYQLNRDGNLLFIVMEYLSGIPLNQFIQKHPNGISLNQARPIIKGICNALAYSHQEGVIHLDFKPSNVFYNPETQAIKVIDFGIARLAEKQDRDLTLFDPGTLGAKTKAYATPEMIVGADPKPSDDVYGLSCVIYKILTGNHPFKDTDSISAETKALKPAPIKNLSKTQFKALERGLAFRRKDRTESASKLYQELFPTSFQTSWHLSRNSAIAAIVLITAIATPVLYKVFDNWQIQKTKNEINALNPDAIDKFYNLDAESQLNLVMNETTAISLVKYYISTANPKHKTLDYIQQLKPDTQEKLFHNNEIQQLLVAHSVNIIGKAIQADDFNLAKSITKRITAQYPDSKKLADQSVLMASAKKERIQELINKFTHCLHDTTRSLVDLSPCLTESENQLSYINPNIQALNNAQLLDRFISETHNAIAENDLLAAEKLLLTWHAMLPAESNKRSELSTLLAYKKKISNLAAQISVANDTALEDQVRNLLAKDHSIRNTVILIPEIRDKLMKWYQSTVEGFIDTNQYKSITIILSQAKNIFSEDKPRLQWINDLEKRALTHRTKNIKSLVDSYWSILKQKELNTEALLSIWGKILEIDPENDLLDYPQVRETYSAKIMAAINNEQSDLAEHYLQGWRILLPKDTETDSFRELSENLSETIHSVKNRNRTLKAIQDDLKNENIDQVLNKIERLKESLTNTDRKLILEAVKTPFLQLLSKRIKTNTQNNNYIAAHQLINIASQNFKNERSILAWNKKIEHARTNRIKESLAKYQALLKVELLQATDLFHQLQSINSADKGYLMSHPELYQTLSNRLKELFSTDYPLIELQNVFTQWKVFLKNTGETEEIINIFESTKNYIALRCLFKAKVLKGTEKLEQATEYLTFGLSLSTSEKITTSLKRELTN